METGIAVTEFQPQWRSFTLETARLVTFDVDSSTPEGGWCVSRACDLDATGCGAGNAAPVSMCLERGRVFFSAWSRGGASTLDVTITDGGPCDPPPHLALQAARVQDLDGDRDGFPDTGETVDVHLRVVNKSYYDFTNAHVTATLDDPGGGCVGIATTTLPLVPARSSADASTPIRFTVPAVADRASLGFSAAQSFVARLHVIVVTDQFPTPVQDTVHLELDLNATTITGPTTTFTENFESSFGAFRLQTLDGAKATNALSDGRRCQYSDPDYPNSNSYGATECYLGFAAGSGSTNLNLWHVHQTSAVDGGRAYAGRQSVHFGRHSTPGMDTYDLSQLDALRMGSPITLAARVCRDDASAHPRACNGDGDCAAVGGPCISASPELSFKHQISLADNRSTSCPTGSTVDKAVVMALVAPSQVWQKIAPYWNVYDAQGTDNYVNCMFDPTDDGNDEDSYFDPTDPYRRLGPSSTCWPEFVFGFLGDTDAAFDPWSVGRAGDGPGLAGALGTGTWVESRFDLSRFRGQSVSIRFLVSTIKVSDNQSMESTFHWNPKPDDDGWYIDDIRISETLGTAAPSMDLDNAAPPPGFDSDGDGVADCADCAPGDPSAFAVPGEVAGLHFNDSTTLSWAAPGAGSGTEAQVVRGALSELPAGGGASEACIATLGETSFTDAAIPDATRAFWYLVRAKNACAIGSWGWRSDGTERTTAACP